MPTACHANSKSAGIVRAGPCLGQRHADRRHWRKKLVGVTRQEDGGKRGQAECRCSWQAWQATSCIAVIRGWRKRSPRQWRQSCDCRIIRARRTCRILADLPCHSLQAAKPTVIAINKVRELSVSSANLYMPHTIRPDRQYAQQDPAWQPHISGTPVALTSVPKEGYPDSLGHLFAHLPTQRKRSQTTSW